MYVTILHGISNYKYENIAHFSLQYIFFLSILVLRVLDEKISLYFLQK